LCWRLSLLTQVFGWVPLLPHIAHQPRAWFEGGFAWLPAGGGHLRTLAGPDELEGFDLPEGFRDVASHRRCHYFEGLDYAVWIDQKASAGFRARLFIIHSVEPADIAVLVGQHWEGDILVAQHLLQLMVIPHLMHIDTVHTDGKDFDTKFFKLRVFLSNC